MARPREWTEERIEELRLDLEEYSDDPDFCHMCLWHARTSTYRDLLPTFIERNSAFSDTLKAAKAKAEAHTMTKGANGTMNPTICVFTQKQHGWTDRQEIEHSGSLGITSLAQTLSDAG
jgi:hypothetical protein